MSLKEQFDPKRLASYLIILAIAFIFAIQWGPGSRGCESPIGTSIASKAAVVNGKDIPLRDFDRAYYGQLQYFRSQGSELPESLARQIGLPNQVLEQLITTELLEQEAERQGILASDAELRDAIRSNPYFQVDGKFDLERYKDVLNHSYRRTVPEYERELRRQIGAQKLLQIIDHAAMVSDDEVKAKFLKEGNKVNLTYVRFLPSMYASRVPAPSAKEIDAFEKSHGQEIEAYYKQNQSLYAKPERVRARHILLKVDKNAPAEKKDEAKKKLEELRKEVLAGKDFGELAKQNSEDVGSKNKGGELGFSDRSGWVPEFSNAAFALKPGEVSQPVESPFGFHLIQVEEKQPAQKKELKDVENDIAKQLLTKQKAQELAKAEAQKALLEMSKSGKTLAELFPPEKEGQPAALRFETEKKPEAVSTGDFSPSGGAIPHLGSAPALSDDAFAAHGPKKLDKVYSAGEAFAVAEVTDRKLADDQAFAAQKDKLREDARRAKQVELRQAFMKSLRKQAQVKTFPEAIDQVTARS